MIKARAILGVVLSTVAMLVIQGVSKSTVVVSKISGKEKVMFAGGSKGGDTGGLRHG